MRNDTERAEALAKLREWLKPGDTVWCILRHVSRSGMQRTIEPVLIQDDGQGNGPEVREIGWAVARALGLPFDRDRGGVKMSGCGMGFHLVYSLSAALWPEGFGCIGENCRSNDHTNGDRDYTPHGCDCRSCAVCKGEYTICGACHMCTRCHEHTPGCKGCGGTPGEGAHWHRDGGYALRQRWL